MKQSTATLRALIMVGSGLVVQGAMAQETPTAATTVSIVTGLSAGDILNIRTKATPFGPVKSRVPNGTSLKNYGCSDFNGYQWCKVEELGRPELVGWTPERYLRTADPAEAEAAIADAAAIQNTAGVNVATDEVPEEALKPPEASATVPSANGIVDTAAAAPSASEPVAGDAASQAPSKTNENAPDAAAPSVAAVETPQVSAAAEAKVENASVDSGAPAAPAQPAKVDAPSAKSSETDVAASAAEKAPIAETVQPETPAGVEKARPRLTAWDKMALAGRALIIGEPSEAAAAVPEPEAVAMADVAPPVAAESATSVPTTGASVAPAAPKIDASAPIKVKTIVVPAPALPVDLVARLGGAAEQSEVAAPAPQTAETFGKTATEDAYTLAFAAQDSLSTGGTAEQPSGDEQSATAETAIVPPDESIPLPSVRPEMHGEQAAASAVESEVVAAAPAAETGVPLAASAQEFSGELPCARYFGQPMTRCAAKIVRTDDDTADVTVTWPDGGTRTINFRGGKADGSNARGGLRATREGELNMIRIGTSERFEITDSLAFGG